MNIRKIAVLSGATFQDPHEAFSNLRTDIKLEAELAIGDNWEACAKELQLRADALAAQHKAQLLAAIEVKRRAMGGHEDESLEDDYVHGQKF